MTAKQTLPDPHTLGLQALAWLIGTWRTALPMAVGVALGALTAESLETNLGARASMMFGAMFIGAFVAARIAGRMRVQRIP